MVGDGDGKECLPGMNISKLGHMAQCSFQIILSETLIFCRPLYTTLKINYTYIIIVSKQPNMT